MTLEYEKLTSEIEQMAREAQGQQRARQAIIEQALAKLHAYATDWDVVEQRLERAKRGVDIKLFRAARPLDHLEPLDAAVDPPPPPAQATIIAADGSQILPDEHAAYLYALINVGLIVYFHGRGRAPLQFTRPVLDYPDRPGRDAVAQFADDPGLVKLRRDQAEIESVAAEVIAQAGADRPLLALLDQRLLYWPGVGTADAAGSEVLFAWQASMSHVRAAGGWLAGYIANPRKAAVLTLLDTLDVEDPGFDWDRLNERRRRGPNDAHLFGRLLGPGQRSKVFLDVSHHNNDFQARDAANAICFFYFNPGRGGQQIARVDLPESVASDADRVGAVHALIYEQCQILGDYPYVLARADELAVVGRQDQQNLEILIENAMQRQGLDAAMTAKQQSKEWARAGRTRHEL
jgi:hypothetical protein